MNGFLLIITAFNLFRFILKITCSGAGEVCSIGYHGDTSQTRCYLALGTSPRCVFTVLSWIRTAGGAGSFDSSVRSIKQMALELLRLYSTARSDLERSVRVLRAVCLLIDLQIGVSLLSQCGVSRLFHRASLLLMGALRIDGKVK